MFSRTVNVIFMLVALALLGVLQYRLWQPGGCLMAYRLQKEVQDQLADNASWRAKNRVLQEKLAWLRSDPQAIEHFARSELGMIRPGESYYVLIER